MVRWPYSDSVFGKNFVIFTDADERKKYGKSFMILTDLKNGRFSIWFYFFMLVASKLLRL